MGKLIETSSSHYGISSTVPIVELKIHKSVILPIGNSCMTVKSGSTCQLSKRLMKNVSIDFV